ncbi:MAG: SCO family protein [Gallionella sp.]|nr:SCO family protein [Gallionella sp.]
MHHLSLPLSLAVLLSVAPLSVAKDLDVSGASLYKTTVLTAKLQVQPEEAVTQIFDEKAALKASQDAIGNRLGDYTLQDRSGRTVRLSDYLGKPLVISMIYTHCPIICATTTRSLSALKLSQDALGADSFGVLTVGFDTENDIPETMGDFAKRMDVNLPNWEFVSSDPDTINKLSKDLGFTFLPSADGGFNHITQTTFIDGEGRVYLHVYGDEFENQTLLQPLKDLIYNIKTAKPGIAGLSNKVKLFCTVYDVKTGKYRLDYSYFYGIGLGVLATLLITWWIVLEHRRSPKKSYPSYE